MSKQRMIRDSFWTDSYIERLTPDEKLIFLYLLTNPLCNVGGIYEIRTKRIGFETGYDIEVIETILGRFERDKKILRHNDWIVIVNHLKNQSLNPSIIQGCQRIFDELPEDIKLRVTGWVQAGLLNLTLLNLTLPNSTPPNGGEEVSVVYDKEETTTEVVKSGELRQDQWRMLIDSFEPVNPFYVDLYKNTTERKALTSLCEKWGYDKLLATIQALPDIVSRPYAPKITKPTELKRDIAKLLLFIKQETIKDKPITNKKVAF